MLEKDTLETRDRSNMRRTIVYVILLVVFVPLGIAGGWFTLAPTPDKLAERARGGLDSEALLELVLQAPYEQQAADSLRFLLENDPDALRSFAQLALGHEAALDYLISMARTRPECVSSLSDWELDYDSALKLLQHIPAEGISRLVTSASQSANAAFVLGVAYELGYHVEQSWSQAAHWYAHALEIGYPLAEVLYSRAAYEVGVECYSRGNQPVETARWFGVAAELGHAAAQCALGVCYASGNGVEKNLQSAVAWYRLSAEQGYADAYFNLGWCYLRGEGVEADAEASVAWFREGAQRGDELAQYYVGRAYEYGQGVNQNAAEAVRWYALAAEEGESAAAQYALGSCYARGQGVEQSWPAAVYWYQLAAEQGWTEAQLALARCYEKGLGVPVNAATAHYWRGRAEKESQPE